MLYPTAIQSSNASTLNIFTGIFYTLRILGGGRGVIRPSANGGTYLEQDILSDIPKEDQHTTPDSLWSFSPSSIPGYYEWGLYSQPGARVAWTPGDTDDDFPLQLRNLTEITQDIYEDPSSGLWEFEQDSNSNFRVRPMNFNSGSVTFTPKPKSPRGWWLQLSKDLEPDSESDVDHTLLLEPSRYKLYGVSEHMDLGEVEDILNTDRVKEHISRNCLINSSPSITLQNVSVSARIEYNVYVQADQEFDIFSGITVINPKTVPSRKYFDLEASKESILNLRGVSEILGTEEVELEPGSNVTISSYVTYLNEFKGLRYHSWTDVSAVADLLSNGRVVRNVLIEDLSLLKHLIRGKGYTGKFWEVPHQGENNGARVRIRTEGVLRGSLPIPFVQFEEVEGNCE